MSDFKKRSFDILGLAIRLDRETSYRSTVSYNGSNSELELIIFSNSFEQLEFIVMGEGFMDSFDVAENTLADYIYNRKGDADE